MAHPNKKSTIGIEGMEFHAYHGVYKAERQKGTRFTVDVYIDFDFEKAAQSDFINDTANYENIYSICEKIIQSPVNLIETVCVTIINEICLKTKGLESIKVRVTKFNPPINGAVKSVFAEQTKVLI